MNACVRVKIRFLLRTAKHLDGSAVWLVTLLLHLIGYTRTRMHMYMKSRIDMSIDRWRQARICTHRRKHTERYVYIIEHAHTKICMRP